MPSDWRRWVEVAGAVLSTGDMLGAILGAAGLIATGIWRLGASLTKVQRESGRRDEWEADVGRRLTRLEHRVGYWTDPPEEDPPAA